LFGWRRLATLWLGPALFLASVLFTPASSIRADDLAGYDRLIKPEQRKHWAFQPVRRPEVPATKDPHWSRNPIDAFILAKLEARGWKPSTAAEPRALLRRLYLDLVGLPPTPAEQQAFLRNPSPAALDSIIEDLLARPAYGERWARHWLDLVRFAETNGYERDADKPNVWRYRDYVIRAFNEDKPYDRFVQEQLAGDELPEANAETIIATGYCRLGPWDDEPADPKEDRFDQLEDMVSTTSLAYLGLTLGCARCHNHKFEPMTQLDYYRMVAVFNPLERPQSGRADVDLPAVSRARAKSMQFWKGKDPRLAQAVVSFGSMGAPAAALATVSAMNPRIDSVEVTRGYFLVEPSLNPPATRLLLRGKASRPGPEVSPGVPTVLVSAQPVFPAKGEHSSLRRLTLARWIANPENPLTARVIVNRVWQFHFGEGLVRTPSDFGVMGEPPTHPELLDWLADWFMKEGWSIKKLHRLILCSNAYRMSAGWDADYGAKDPENRLLWRMHYRRLDIEAIRDSVLAVSGQLNAKMYGPSMYPQVPKEALDGHSDPDKIWKPFDERDSSRRTIYAFVKRSMVVPMLEVMDLCDTTRSSAKRVVTTVAPQALSLFNGDFINRQSRQLATRLRTEVGDDPKKQIAHAYILALCRPPSATETEAMAQFMNQETERLIAERPTDPSNARRIALEQMCRVILNLNEFVYPD
jgi:hypothetical protein